MAGKKKTKKVKAKNVEHVKGKANVEKEVLVDAPDDEAVPTPPPAIAEEVVMKVVDKGITRYYTKTEYDKKFSKKD